MEIAITRQVSRSIGNCKLTFLPRQTIDLERARKQHAQYETALRDLGLAVLSLPEEPDMPDAVFVEDTALVLDECAVVLRPGADSRLSETASIAGVLAPFRELQYIQTPARIDGGDILRLGKRIYAGLTKRSDTQALSQLKELLAPRGYELHGIPVNGCLHLKSAVTQVAPHQVLMNSLWVDRAAFVDVEIIEVDPSEQYAGNALLAGEALMYDAAFPLTGERLFHAGLQPVIVEADELAKAEGGLTCCSLIFAA